MLLLENQTITHGQWVTVNKETSSFLTEISRNSHACGIVQSGADPKVQDIIADLKGNDIRQSANPDGFSYVQCKAPIIL